MKVLGRLHDYQMDARRRQASEKRQGTKSREVSTVGAAGYGELGSSGIVTLVDFGGSSWLGRPTGGWARVFGGRERGSRDCLMLLWRRVEGRQGERGRRWAMTDVGDGWLCGE